MNLARCPGCGDNGDLAHVVACTMRALDRRATRAWRSGAEFVLFALAAQVRRRGDVDLERLLSAVDAIARRDSWRDWDAWY